jgi:hypothetical protein
MKTGAVNDKTVCHVTLNVQLRGRVCELHFLAIALPRKQVIHTDTDIQTHRHTHAAL